MSIDTATNSPTADGTVGTTQKALNYRADIDGLRGVAVLSVLFFHMGFLRLTGGFVGVDVFFVISGYLISSIVFFEIASSRFSIVAFYQRRIRRIFPALFAMLAVFTVFAVIYLFPTEFVNYAKSLMAATTSVSNFYFWQHSKYFDDPISNPLLHTWSLGVEEQFYIIFPIFLVLVRKLFPQRLRAAVVVLFFISLVASAYIVLHHPMTSFYMLYTRAWELLMGTILSLGMFPRLKNPVLRNAGTLVGIGLIAYSTLRYTQFTQFPGLSALIPCLGAALIIGAGESGNSIVGAILSWRPIVFIGLISYSLYLWHWPVVIVQHLGEFGPMQHGMVAVVALILGYLSWQFVERPFRFGRLRMNGRPLFITAGAVMATFILVSATIIYNNGFPGRFSARADKIASSLDTPSEGNDLVRTGVCFFMPGDTIKNYNFDTCLHRDPAKKDTYLLIGDSHAAVLWAALDKAMPDANILQATGAPCEETRAEHPTLYASQTCIDLMNYIFQTYLPTHPVQAIYLEGRWADAHINAIARTIEWAKNHQIPIVLFGPVPEYDEALPRLLAYSVAWNKPSHVIQHRIAKIAETDAKLQMLAANKWHVPYISLYQEICNTNGCMEYVDPEQTIPLMQDRDHFTKEGAQLIINRLVKEGKLP